MAEQDDVTVSQTWDPYEVWLQRVRRPRDSSDAMASSDRIQPRPRLRS